MYSASTILVALAALLSIVAFFVPQIPWQLPTLLISAALLIPR